MKVSALVKMRFLGINLIKFFRVLDWLHLLSITLFGLIYVTTGIHLSIVLFALVVSSLYLAYGYSLNETFDTAIEEKHGRKFLVEYSFSLRKGVFLSSIPLLVATLISLLHSIEILLVIIIGAFFGVCYSVPPLRLKSKGLAGLLCNSLCFCPLFLIGTLAFDVINARIINMLVHFILVMIPLQLIHELEHKLADQSKGINTTICKYGTKKGLWLVGFTLVVMTGWSVFLWYVSTVHLIFVISTFLFSSILVFFLLKRYDKSRNFLNTRFLKKKARYIALLYGAFIFISLIIKKDP